MVAILSAWLAEDACLAANASDPLSGLRGGFPMATVIVGGALANKPLNGGEAWVRLTWALGLRRLGHSVCLVEQIVPEHCVNRRGDQSDFASSINRAYFERVAGEFGLEGSACLVCGDGSETAGLPYSELLDRAADADFLVNISGHITDGEVLRRPRQRVYVDLDPGFTQFWHAAGTPGFSLAHHDHYVTVAANIGTTDCPIPTGGLRWHVVAPPVLLHEWSEAPAPTLADRFTTIATWRSPYGPVEYEGRAYGLKHHEFRRFLDLPHRVAAQFELALDIDPADSADLAALRDNGWRVVDPREAVPDPSSFRRFVRESAAEFSVAQGIYVETNSGWFSDRTASYLASGRPALVQDTGFSRNLPAGDGLLAFRTLDDAVAGVERIASDYEDHCGAARAIAEEHFDSDRVLGELLDDLGVFG
jgi:hypothetical protein